MNSHLSKETAFAAHKALWTWMAEIAKTGQRPNKLHFWDDRYPAIDSCECKCYLCEYAVQHRTKNSEKCAYCPAKWPDTEYNRSQNEINCCILSNNNGLMDQYLKALNDKNFDKASALALKIANIPERLSSIELTIKAHRALWNWMADTIEQTDKFPNKKDFKSNDLPNIQDCHSHCYLCEYTYHKQFQTNVSKKCGLCQVECIFIHKRCDLCPVEWPENYCMSKLYTTYCDAKDDNDKAKAIYLARQIANLPEKSEEKE